MIRQVGHSPLPPARNETDRKLASDVLHAYLGLASLALIGHTDLENINPTFCISKRARSKLSRVSWWRA